jgi:hypothetical protein
MTLFDFIRDMQTNAPPERAGLWLRTNAEALPELARALETNLHATPTAVIEAMANHWPMAMLYHRHENALNFIRALQQWLRDHPKGTL